MSESSKSCSRKDCFAYGDRNCKALAQIPSECRFYKNKKQFYEENAYLPSDSFKILFGEEMLEERRLYNVKSQCAGREKHES